MKGNEKNTTEFKTEKSNKSSLAILLVLVLVILGLFYFAVARYYTDRFPARTWINDVNVSNMTADAAELAVENAMSEYQLTIYERNDVVESISGNNINLEYDVASSIGENLEQYNPYLWLSYIFREDKITCTADVMYDQQGIKDAISSLNCFNEKYVTKMQNASLTWEDGTLQVTQEVQGNELDEEAAIEAITNAIVNGESEIDLDKQGLYLSPTVTMEDLKQSETYQTISTWIGCTITFDFEDNRIETIDNNIIQEWIVENEDGEYNLDSTAVLEWVKTNLAYQYDTFGLTHTFETSGGKTITLTGGDYGWCIARQDTTDLIIKSIKSGYSGELKPEYQYTAMDRSTNDIGDTYVEVSIDEQTLWCYKNGKLVVKTDVVTGCVAKGTETPSGSVWAFDSHKKDAVLGTLDTMGYESPVNYWMSFYGNYGVHDADGWRSSYGGSIYKTNGSHGCINVPEEAMEKVFNTVNVGYPIIIY